MRRLILAISICSAILVNAGSALAESTLGTTATTSESDLEQDQMEAQGGRNCWNGCFLSLRRKSVIT